MTMGAFISMVPSIGILLGSIVIGFLVKKFDLSEKWTVSVCIACMALAQVALCFLEL